MIPDSQQGLYFRRALFTVHLCRVDFLRVNCDCLASFAQKRAQPVPAVPRLGLSLDAAHLFGCRGRPYRELVDDPACAVLARPGSHPGRHSILLPLAQVAWRFRRSLRSWLTYLDRFPADLSPSHRFPVVTKNRYL